MRTTWFKKRINTTVLKHPVQHFRSFVFFLFRKQNIDDHTDDHDDHDDHDATPGHSLCVLSSS